MSGIVVKGKAVEQVVIKRHPREPERPFGRRLKIEQTTGLAHADAITKEFYGIGKMLDDVTCYHQIKSIIRIWKLFLIQIRACKGESGRRWAVRRTIIDSKMLQLSHSKRLSKFHLFVSHAPDVQHLPIFRKLLINLANLARRPGGDQVPDAHAQEKIICEPGALILTVRS